MRNKHNHAISVRGASEHNLKSVNIEIPLNRLVCITGVSGSGKPSKARRSAKGDPNGRAESDERVQSTLIEDVLFA